MEEYGEYFQSEEALEEALSMPTPEVIELVKELNGDIIFLGVAGKMGVSMSRMARPNPAPRLLNSSKA